MYRLGLTVCLLFSVVGCLLAANDVDSDCRISGALTGKCKLVPDCPVALGSLKKMQSHNLKRCGFEGFTEIVCCPVTIERNPSEAVMYTKEDDKGANQQSRFTKRKCEQACEELSDEVKSKVGFNIIGGEDAEIGEFPHMVALGYETDEGLQWDCGASIISKRYLLTAAHCIANIKRLMPKRARMGVIKLNDENPQDYIVHNFTINPNYDPLNKHNDIALIEVKGEMKFSKKVYPACLYYEHDDPVGLIVTGWGKTSIAGEDDRSNVLQKATLVPMSVAKCNVSILARTVGTRTVINAQICAGSNDSDACWGDSGGPLQVQNAAGSYSVVGIISYGAGCGGKTPGVYTRVSKYLYWIENIVWP